jgi:hypothetical protein
MENDVKSKLDELDQRLIAINKRFDDMQWVLGMIIIFFGIVITANSGLAVYLFIDQSDAKRNISDQLQKALKEQDDKLSKDEDDIRRDSHDLLNHASTEVDRQTNFVSGYISNTRSDILEFKSEVDRKLSEGYGDPRVEILGADNLPLQGGQLEAVNGMTPANGFNKPVIRFELRVHNSGSGPTGPLALKFYSDDIPFVGPSDNFDAGHHTDVLYPNIININSLTGGTGVPGAGVPGGFTYIDGFNLDVQKELPPGQYHALIRCYFGPRKSVTADTRVVFVIKSRAN